MDERAQKGRTILLIYIVLILLASVITIFAYTFRFGVERLPLQLGRLAITVVLLVCLWNGSKAAKMISVVLFTAGGALAAPYLFRESLPVVAALAPMTILYLSFARVLIWSDSVNHFLDLQAGGVTPEQYRALRPDLDLGPAPRSRLSPVSPRTEKSYD